LRRIFKKLDPTVAKADSDIQGEIQVSLKYDFIKELLLVKIIKCRDLGLNSISGKTAEPFIMVLLLANGYSPHRWLILNSFPRYERVTYFAGESCDYTMTT